MKAFLRRCLCTLVHSWTHGATWILHQGQWSRRCKKCDREFYKAHKHFGDEDSF
jgi:hypothetical protein